jgi:hypothetical protein
VIVVFKKRCKFCHAMLEAGLMQVFPKIVGLPQVRCRRCHQATTLPLAVALVSSVAGFFVAAFVVLCYFAAAESVSGRPFGIVPFVLAFPIGLAAWMLGYIGSAACCYAIHRIWKSLHRID